MSDDELFALEEEEFAHLRAAQKLRERRLREELADEEVERNLSYEPPFSGSRPQEQAALEAVHPRWIRLLSSVLPVGVPTEETVSGHASKGRWPLTWGDVVDGENRHREPGNHCMQCGSCQFYVPLEGDLGSDWGACTNPRSQYDRTCTFEHWTCKEFKR